MAKEITYGDVVYDKLDGRAMIVMEVHLSKDQKMYRCRYYDKSDVVNFASMYEYEITRKKRTLGFRL